MACLVHIVEWVPGLSRILFSQSGWGKLRSKCYTEHITSIPLPFPKEVFGIEDDKIVEGFDIIYGRNKTNDNVDPYTKGYLYANDFRQAYLSKNVTPLQVSMVDFIITIWREDRIGYLANKKSN